MNCRTQANHDIPDGPGPRPRYSPTVTISAGSSLTRPLRPIAERNNDLSWPLRVMLWLVMLACLAEATFAAYGIYAWFWK